MLTTHISKEKATKYKRVVISRKGPPEVLQVVEEELAEPEPTEPIAEKKTRRNRKKEAIIT